MDMESWLGFFQIMQHKKGMLKISANFRMGGICRRRLILQDFCWKSLGSQTCSLQRLKWHTPGCWFKCALSEFHKGSWISLLSCPFVSDAIQLLHGKWCTIMAPL